MKNRKMDKVKLVVVGDVSVGKTALIISYNEKKFPECFNCIPRVYDDCQTNLMVDGAPVALQLWDTIGCEDMDRLRSLYYQNTDVFLICYSVSSVESLEHVRSRWIPEVSYSA